MGKVEAMMETNEAVVQRLDELEGRIYEEIDREIGTVHKRIDGHLEHHSKHEAKPRTDKPKEPDIWLTKQKAIIISSLAIILGAIATYLMKGGI